MPYRISRNIEASIIDYIRTEITGAWSNIHVEKTFARIYDIELPSICIRVGVTTHEKVEIGADATIRTPVVLLDIFATSDGQRLDIKDFLIEKLKSGLPYYDYTIVNGAITDKTENGRIRVLEISDDPIDFDVDKNTLDTHDSYRHLLSLSISLGRVEE